MAGNFTQYAFTERVRELQERHGSRRAYARMEHSGDRYMLTDAERQMVATRDGFYLSTVSSDGWPYVQFRGGPVGFLKVLDVDRIGFADLGGNRQCISAGNILDGGKAMLFLMD